MIKADPRGGERKAKVLKTSQALLLAFIWEKFGGVAAIAKRIGSSRQHPINWRLKGYVPLEWIGPLSRSLEIPKHAFNYEEVVRYEGISLPWKDIVNIVSTRLDMPRQVKSLIMAGEKPKEL